MQRFIAPSARPKAIATPRSAAERPRTRGRQIATRIIAANALRPNAAPAGAGSSNRPAAKAAPTCSEATASSTSPAAGGRADLRAGGALLLMGDECRERTLTVG